MDIRGLVLVNAGVSNGAGEFPWSAAPLALVEVAGRSPLGRIAERLRRYGVSQSTVVLESPVLPQAANNGAEGTRYSLTGRQRFWRAAESAFNDMAQEGAELVLVLRLGAYAEVDFERLVQFHLERACRVSQLVNEAGTLEVFCISASRRNDAASLFRSGLTRCRSECPVLEHQGYVNPLASAADLRQFAIDILTLETETSPAGEQWRPGVWVAPGAKIERGARLLAPAFIGRAARLRSGAVITRCSAIEHHAEVDCGTVVENSSVLPYSYLGAGLDLAHSVVGMGAIANLRRNAVVEMADPRLVGHIAATTGRNFLRSAAAYCGFLLKQVWQGFPSADREPQPDIETALQRTSPALGDAAGFQAPACNTKAADEYASMAVARRYGNE
ncbi:MAG TPA: hypothetical protein VF532_05520 [Candidatus Angelobacter sp.]